MIVVDGVNVWQLTTSGDGSSQDKTEAQRIADGWPPPDGTPVMKADKSIATHPKIGKDHE